MAYGYSEHNPQTGKISNFILQTVLTTVLTNCAVVDFSLFKLQHCNLSFTQMPNSD